MHWSTIFTQIEIEALKNQNEELNSTKMHGKKFLCAGDF
jgi:hypothetical protein